MGATTNTRKQKELVKYYLEYLEKEITFTGIITTFTIASIWLIVDKQFTKDSSFHLIQLSPGLFLLAMLFLAIASFLQLVHRQELSYHYGMICLEIYSTGRTPKTINKWLDDVDSWSFWRMHLAAIGFMISAYGLIVILFLISLYPKSNCSMWIVSNPTWFAVLYTILSIVVRILTYLNLIKEHPENARE